MSTRKQILVSGYYGFDNLGDEAILEEITSQLAKLTSRENIVVLSANPELTAKQYGVQSFVRTDVKQLATRLKQARLFVSGGGGLFQNTRSLGSIIFYGMQIQLARLAGVPVMIYAQGIGPLRGAAADALTRYFFSQAQVVAIRDDASAQICQRWSINAQRTADPVWGLAAGELPQTVEALFNPDATNVAISLRPHQDLTDEHCIALADLLAKYLPKPSRILLASLQPATDTPVLARFKEMLDERQLDSRIVNPDLFEYPSTWLSFFERADMTVAMRLHALVMALKSGRPAAAIGYDPKVTAVANEFGQPILILTKEPDLAGWEECLKTLVGKRTELAARASAQAQMAKNSACQNFALLAKILDKQNGSGP